MTKNKKTYAGPSQHLMGCLRETVQRGGESATAILVAAVRPTGALEASIILSHISIHHLFVSLFLIVCLSLFL